MYMCTNILFSCRYIKINSNHKVEFNLKNIKFDDIFNSKSVRLIL